MVTGAPAAPPAKAAAPAPAEPWRDPAAQPFVRIEGLTKTFGKVYACDDVSLDIYRGEFFALLGGSGSGKSTLLRILAGLETPDRGRILIDGVDVTRLPPYQRPVNMMFQSYALFPHMTVEQNIAFGLRQDRLPASEIRDRVEEMLKLVRMPQLGRRKPHQLSGGQRQRVALARALAKEPKLLLLDEPLGALDKRLREHTQFELVNIQERVGVTFIVVTHDQEEAMTLASRIGLMNQGYIAQVGTPHEIYEFPNSRFVAEFIGSVNMFEGRIVEDEPDHVTIDSPELGGMLYVGHGVSTAPDALVWAAIRPEKMVLSREAPPGEFNRASGIVQEIAYMGDLSIYLIKLDSGKTVRVTQPNIVRHAEDRFTWDDRVWVSWDESSSVVVTK